MIWRLRFCWPYPRPKPAGFVLLLPALLRGISYSSIYFIMVATEEEKSSAISFKESLSTQYFWWRTSLEKVGCSKETLMLSTICSGGHSVILRGLVPPHSFFYLPTFLKSLMNRLIFVLESSFSGCGTDILISTPRLSVNNIHPLIVC